MHLGLEIRVERSKALAGVLLTSEFSPGVAIRVAMATSGQLVSVRGRFKKCAYQWDAADASLQAQGE